MMAWAKLRQALLGKHGVGVGSFDALRDGNDDLLRDRIATLHLRNATAACRLPDACTPLALEVALLELRACGGRPTALLHDARPPSDLLDGLSRRSGRTVICGGLGEGASLCAAAMSDASPSEQPYRVVRTTLAASGSASQAEPLTVFSVESPSAVGVTEGCAAAPLSQRLAQLVSHRTPVCSVALGGGGGGRGVDATGLVRVWPCERVLAAVLASWAALPVGDTVASAKDEGDDAGPLATAAPGPPASSSSSSSSSSGRLLDGLRVVELGAGSSGLAGLALAAAARSTRVLLTDGHPDAARVLAANVRLNSPGGVLGCCGFEGDGCDSTVESDCLVFDAAAAALRAGAAAAGASEPSDPSPACAMYGRTALHSAALAQAIVVEAAAAAAAATILSVVEAPAAAVAAPCLVPDMQQQAWGAPESPDAGLATNTADATAHSVGELDGAPPASTPAVAAVAAAAAADGPSTSGSSGTGSSSRSGRRNRHGTQVRKRRARERRAAALEAALGRNSGGGAMTSLSSALASWGAAGSLAGWQRSGSYVGAFNLAVAADVLFFESFHVDLLHALAVMLVPPPPAAAVPCVWRVAPPPQREGVRANADAAAADDQDGGGLARRSASFDPRHPRHDPRVRSQAWLVAPSRGGSLERFVRLARAFHLTTDSTTEAGGLDTVWRPFDVEVYDDFDADVTAAYAAGRGSDAPSTDVQRPLLVVLRLTCPPRKAVPAPSPVAPCKALPP